MCKLKSGIILKDRIFVPDYDSHSKMLEELGIKDDYMGASKTFVRAELSPKDGDAFTPVDEWEFRVDQDIVPDWFSEEEYKPRMVESVKSCAAERIHVGKKGLRICTGAGHMIKDCDVSYIGGSASVSKICDSASVSTYVSWDKREVKMSGFATIRDFFHKKIYQAGGFEFVPVKEKVDEQH